MKHCPDPYDWLCVLLVAFICASPFIVYFIQMKP